MEHEDYKESRCSKVIKEKLTYRIDGWSLDKFDISKKDVYRNDLKKKKIYSFFRSILTRDRLIIYL